MVEGVEYVQDAIELNATECLVDANNYALYAGGESCLLVVLLPWSFVACLTLGL